MSTRDQAIHDLVELGLDVAAHGDLLGRMLLSSEFMASSVAKSEEGALSIAGIKTGDVTSMFIVRIMLGSYIRAATEHIRAAALLIESDEPALPLLSIAALSRISCEASSVAFWLSDPAIGWADRLKRCNQLQYKAFEEAKAGSTSFSTIIETSWIEKKIDEYEEEMIVALNWANEKGWTCNGRPPSRSNWGKAVPSFNQLTRDLVKSSGEPAVLGRALYSGGSGVVHSNPILVGMALDELTPAAREFSAALKCKTALRFYCLLTHRVNRWTGWQADTDWFNTAERACAVLFPLYVKDLPNQLDSDEELQEYLQHISDAITYSRPT